MYGMPENRAESQLLEAWPASHYGHLRESDDLGVAANSHFAKKYHFVVLNVILKIAPMSKLPPISLILTQLR